MWRDDLRTRGGAAGAALVDTWDIRTALSDEEAKEWATYSACSRLVKRVWVAFFTDGEVAQLPQPLWKSSGRSTSDSSLLQKGEGEGGGDTDTVTLLAVGDRVRHRERGLGTVRGHILDGRTLVGFESGEVHRYKQSSLHKFELVENTRVTGGSTGTNSFNDKSTNSFNQKKAKMASRIQAAWRGKPTGLWEGTRRSSEEKCDPPPPAEGFSDWGFEMVKAAGALLSHGAQFVYTADDAFNPSTDPKHPGMMFPLPGPGMFAEMMRKLMYPHGQEAIFCCGKGGNMGKKYMMEAAIGLLRQQGHSGERRRIVMVGDRFDTDIRAGLSVGTPHHVSILNTYC